MNRVMLTVSALAAGMLLVVPAARAGTPDVVYGGCYFSTDSQPTVTGDVQTGVIGDASVTASGDSTPQPIGATVTCWIEVNGVTEPGTTHSYGDLGGIRGVQAGADPLSFAAYGSDMVEVCESVTFADGTTQAACPVSAPSEDTCAGPVGGGGSFQFPPQQTEDLLNVLLIAISSDGDNCVFVPVVDPAVCPVLKQLAGSYPSGVTVGPDGDLDAPDPLGMWDGPLYDCPPYVSY